MLRADKLQPDRACVLVIDMQEKLLPLILRREQMITATRKLLDGACIFHVPIIVTEQYPKGLGSTHGSLRVFLRANNAQVLEKPTFSACDNDGVRATLDRLDRQQIILAGIETHICVQQTTLDLLTLDYDVFVCADATGSRGVLDYDTGLQRMRSAGANVTTVESVLFELCGRCDTGDFKRMLEVIKSSPPPQE